VLAGGPLAEAVSGRRTTMILMTTTQAAQVSPLASLALALSGRQSRAVELRMNTTWQASARPSTLSACSLALRTPPNSLAACQAR